MRPIVIAFALMLASCSAGSALKREAEEAVRHQLRDPDSAQFRYDYVEEVYPDLGLACGEVNSKNAYGGFAGFEMFAYSREEGAVLASSNMDRFNALQQRCLAQVNAETQRLRNENNAFRERNPEMANQVDIEMRNLNK